MPPRRVELAVWLDDGECGRYGDEVVPWTDYGMPGFFRFHNESDWPLVTADVVRRNRPVIFGPYRAPTDLIVTAKSERSLDVAAAFAHLTDGCLIDEIPMGATHAELTDYLITLELNLHERGLSDFKWVYLAPEYIEAGGNGWQSTEIDVLGLGAYIDPIHQDKPQVKQMCRDRLLWQMDRVGDQPLFLVPQAYRQTRNGITWTNNVSLLAIQDVAYEIALTDTRVKAVTPFCWEIGPGRGLRSLPTEFVQRHQWWRTQLQAIPA